MSGRKLNAKQKEAEALRLHLLGYSNDEIAREVGYRDRSGAWRAVDRALARSTRPAAEVVRRAEVARLDLLLRAAFEVLAADHYVVNAGKVVHRITEYARDESGNYLVSTEGDPLAAKIEVLYDDGPKLAAIDRILKIMARRARLLGLDAPAKFEAVHPDLVAEETRKLAEQLGMAPEELAAFEAEAARLIEEHAAAQQDGT